MRKVIQIVQSVVTVAHTTGILCTALCDDGSLWQTSCVGKVGAVDFNLQPWERIEGPPQKDKEEL